MKDMGALRKLGILACAAMIGCALAAGCSSGQSSSSAAASSSSAEPSSSAASESASSEAAIEADIEIGEKGEAVKDLYFKNALGKEINEIAILPAGSEEEAGNLLAEGQAWGDGQVALVHVDPALGACNVALICGDQAYILHDIDTNAVESEIQIMLEGDVAYVAFERGGSVVNSRNEEVALHEAELAAIEEAVADQADSQEVYYYDDSAYYGGGGGGGDAQPAQAQDSCVEGGVALR